MPRAPTIIKIHPTTLRSTPLTFTFRAKVEDRAEGKQDDGSSESHAYSLPHRSGCTEKRLEQAGTGGGRRDRGMPAMGSTRISAACPYPSNGSGLRDLRRPLLAGLRDLPMPADRLRTNVAVVPGDHLAALRRSRSCPLHYANPALDAELTYRREVLEHAMKRSRSRRGAWFRNRRRAR